LSQETKQPVGKVLAELDKRGEDEVQAGGGATKMMGFKEQAFAPLVAVSLSETLTSDR
jgi:hypothetical protein